MTTLFHAVQAGNAEAVRQLANADTVNTPNEDGQSALHIAVMLGKTEIVTILLASGADIELPNEAGKTPIQLAAMMKNCDMFNFLAFKGANSRKYMKITVDGLEMKVSAYEYLASDLYHKVEPSMLEQAGAAAVDLASRTATAAVNIWSDLTSIFSPDEAGARAAANRQIMSVGPEGVSVDSATAAAASTAVASGTVNLHNRTGIDVILTDSVTAQPGAVDGLRQRAAASASSDQQIG